VLKTNNELPKLTSICWIAYVDAEVVNQTKLNLSQTKNFTLVQGLHDKSIFILMGF